MLRKFVGGAVCALVIGLTNPVAAVTAPELVTEGRQLLFNNGNPTYTGILAAHQKFIEAQAAAPTNQEANAFLAVTRIAVFALANNPQTGLDSLAEVLMAFGFSKSRDYVLQGFPYDPPPTIDDNGWLPPTTAPDGAALQALLTGPGLAVADAALANLANITDNTLVIRITTTELADTEPLEVDYGDVLLARAALSYCRFLGKLYASHDVNVNLRTLFQLGNADVLQLQRDLLDAYPQLFTTKTTGPASMGQARQALIDAISSTLAGVAFIRAETDDQADDMATITPLEWAEMNAPRYYLDKLQKALINHSLFDTREKTEHWLSLNASLAISLQKDELGNFIGGEMTHTSSPTWQIASWTTSPEGALTAVMFRDNNALEMLEVNGTVTGNNFIGNYTWSGGYPTSQTGSGQIGLTRGDDTPLSDDTRFNLDKLFGNSSASPAIPPRDIRGLLPRFNEDDYIIAGTFPHPEAGGILNDISLADAVSQEAPDLIVHQLPVTSGPVLNGDIADWAGLNPAPLVFHDDDAGLTTPPTDANNLTNLSMAIAPDRSYLYWAVQTENGQLPAEDYSLYLNLFPPDSFGGLFGTLSKSGPTTTYSIWNGFTWQNTPMTPADYGLGAIAEARIPLSLVPPTQKYLETSARLSLPQQYREADSFATNTVQLPTGAISGQVTCPAGADANIVVKALELNNPFQQFRQVANSARLNGSGPFAFTLNGLLPGQEVKLSGLCDADGNGVLSIGDTIVEKSTTVTAPATGVSMDVSTLVDDSFILPKPGLYRIFGHDGPYSPPDWIDDPLSPETWGADWNFLGEGMGTQVFDTPQRYEWLLIIWPSSVPILFDAFEDLAAGTAFGTNADGSPATTEMRSGLTDYLNFTGHPDGRPATSSSGGGGNFVLFRMPSDALDPAAPRQLRLTYPPIPGDLNADGALTLADFIFAMKLMVARGSYANGLSDMNMDGKVNMADILSMLQKIAGLRP